MALISKRTLRDHLAVSQCQTQSNRTFQHIAEHVIHTNLSSYIIITLILTQIMKINTKFGPFIFISNSGNSQVSNKKDIYGDVIRDINSPYLYDRHLYMCYRSTAE